MKKRVVFILSVAVILLCSLLLSACTGLFEDNQPQTDNPSSITEKPEETKGPEATEEPLSFILMDGVVGEYGIEVKLNEGTELEETEIAYHIPAGSFSVTNLNSNGAVQVSVYSGGPEYDGEWQYFVADDNCPRPLVIFAGETKELTIFEGQFVVLSDGSSNVQFVMK